MARGNRDDTAVVVSRDGAVGSVRLARSAKANALRVADKAWLAAAVRDLSEEDAVRAIVLDSATDGVFCAGTDIREMAEMGPDDALAMFAVEADMYAAILSARIPIVAGVDGVALGAGCILAYCADLCVATERSRFGHPEVRNGVPAPAQVAALTYVVGFNRARSMLLGGAELDGRQAEAWGLVHACVPRERQAEEVAGLLDRLVSLPRQALELQKRILFDSLAHGFSAATTTSPHVAAHAFVSGAHREAIIRFLDARARSDTGGPP